MGFKKNVGFYSFLVTGITSVALLASYAMQENRKGHVTMQHVSQHNEEIQTLEAIAAGEDFYFSREEQEQLIEQLGFPKTTISDGYVLNIVPYMEKISVGEHVFRGYDLVIADKKIKIEHFHQIKRGVLGGDPYDYLEQGFTKVGRVDQETIQDYIEKRNKRF